jgi:ABC-2 type transport system permease protein
MAADALRPYAAAFTARFQLMLQYRAAALAGFTTQCWFGAVKVMVLAAFYAGDPHVAAAAPITLAQAITYCWLGQGLLALSPWIADPEVSLAVRTGAVSYDRLRPVDTYSFWYVRSAAWMTARAAPRAALMIAFAGIGLPALGFPEWAWSAPPDLAAGLAFVPALLLMIALSASFVMLANVLVAMTLNDRGVNSIMMPAVIIFSGSLLPLQLMPDGWRLALFIQPFAGLMDIPFRIYFGDLRGPAALAGLGLQAAWTVVFVLAGRRMLEAAMSRLQVQGG